MPWKGEGKLRALTRYKFAICVLKRTPCEANYDSEQFTDKSLNFHGEIAMKRSSVTNKLNLEEKMYTLEQTLNSWKRRNLTLINRINIVETLQSCIQHLAFRTISNPLKGSANKIIVSLIWEGETPKIKKKNIISERNAAA